MASTDTGDDTPILSPDEAFVALGNETRIQALQVLGRVESPLSFTDLRKRVGMEDPGQFNYHLDKLKGHFIRQVGDKYALRESGSRVVQAVLSGAVTGSEGLEPTPLDAPCPLCGGSIAIQFAEERVLVKCRDCAGNYAGSETDARFLERSPEGTLAYLTLPPAGLDGRTPREILDTSLQLTHLEILALANGFCPRCSSRVEQTLIPCTVHDSASGVCDACNLRHALPMYYDCTNCTKVEERVPSGMHITASPEFQAYASMEGISVPGRSWPDASFFLNYDEAVLSTDPFRAQLMYAGGENPISLTVDKNLDIMEVNA